MITKNNFIYQMLIIFELYAVFKPSATRDELEKP